MASSSERLAGLGFLFIILMQVPFIVVRTPVTQTGIATLGPLQVSCAKLAQLYPAAQKYAEMALIPGAWTYFSLFPYIRCMAKTSLHGPCTRETARLWDPAWAYKKANLKLLVNAISGKEFREGESIAAGSALLVLSAIFSLVYFAKITIAGFALIGYGIYMGKHDVLPPFLLSAFLCVYAGFQLGETKDRRRQRQRAAATKKQKSSSAGGLAAAGSKSSSDRTSSGSTPSKSKSKTIKKTA